MAEIPNQIKYDDINIIYNFFIQPVKNYQTFTVQNKVESFIYYSNPFVLDLFNNDNVTIDFTLLKNGQAAGKKLNQDSEI